MSISSIGVQPPAYDRRDDRPPDAPVLIGVRPDEVIDGAVAAHARLLAHASASVGGPGDAARPSLLPGWTVGHVLTHLARNADSHAYLLVEAAGGRIGDQYPGGIEQRAGDIGAGAGRSIGDIVDDLRASCARLEAGWAIAPPEVWEHGRARAGGGAVEMAVHELPFRRWREVEVHHADLGLPGFGPDDWSSGYIRRELDRQLMAWRASQPMGMGGLPAAANSLAPARRLAWLLGRIEVAGLANPGLMG